MYKSSSKVSERVRKRREEVRKEAKRARKFSQLSLTNNAAKFILFGMAVELERDKIIAKIKLDGEK